MGAQVDLQSPHDTKLAHQRRRHIRCPRHRCQMKINQTTDSLLRLELDMSTFYSKHQQVTDRQFRKEGDAWRC